ncbi:unnamed protein product [Cylicocyclus nassatus]|uniref:Uncharacterized protein n=1 Tax=Cylicocyclus nassatus TaxID=53992 RepID=A0AA36GG92_CYLNA|nr:unnamed protein product [Cylicocyclus nassatus]
MSQRYPSSTTATPQRRPLNPENVPNVFLGVAIQIARKFLFIDPRRKALACLAFVSLLSMIGSFITLDDSYYLVQKHSILNQYGVKLGWMWTCFAVGPFIWFASRAHHRDKDKSVIDILRLAVATGVWYISVGLFHRITEWTSRCDLSVRYSRMLCKEKGGVWIPGFDVSGHCFLLIYSMLVMAEEANAFREWHQVAHRDDDAGRSALPTPLIQTITVLFCFMHSLVDFPLNIVCLHRRVVYVNMLSTVNAVFVYFVTCRLVARASMLSPRIQDGDVLLFLVARNQKTKQNKDGHTTAEYTWDRIE